VRVRIVPRKIRRNPSTPHIKRLNESGASDRASFVKQLGMAFKTPAKIDLHYDFGANFQVEVPPLPPPPTSGSMATTSANVSTLGLEFRPSLSCWISVTSALFKRHPQRIVRASTFRYVTQSTELFRSTYSTCSTQSEHSEEELDRPFKFGGRPNCKNPSSNHVIRHHTSSRSLEVTESS